MNNIVLKTLLTTILMVAIISNVLCNSNIEGDKKEETKKDTINALVITPNNPFFDDLSVLNGDEIIALIDSLLDQKEVSKILLKELNDYVENRVLEHDFYVSLTNFYDDSPIPSNSMYGKWDTENISAYDDEISSNDTSLMLTLIDTQNLCNFAMPIQNPVITSYFGYREGRSHNGIDLDLEVWDPVVASFDGMVRIALKHPGYGRVVVIRHYNGLETLYAHLHRIKVKAGDIVEAGQLIGLGGSSGRSTGSHLHFEVRFKGKALNPKHLISFNENKLISESVELKKQKHTYLAIPSGVEFHTVERGDYMHKIATRYGITVKELCDLNDMKKGSTLRIGRQVRIK